MTHGSVTRITQTCHSADLGGEPVIDASVIGALQELVGDDDPDFIVEVIDLFMTDSAQRVGELRTAAEEDDRKTVAQIAHALKSASANVGAVVLAGVCEHIEGVVRDDEQADLRDPVAQVVAMFTEVRDVLASLRACFVGEVN